MIYGNKVTIYSSTLILLLLALVSWLNTYKDSPQTANFGELQRITNEFEMLKEKEVGNKSNTITYMGWFYPGEPACEAVIDINAFDFAVIKPEYFSVQAVGELVLLDVDDYGCNGFSAENVEIIKNSASQQFVTISSAGSEDMLIFLQKDRETGSSVRRLVDFVVDNNLTGIEIDFEDYSSWSHDIVYEYKDFIDRLGRALHSKNKQLMVDLPPISGEEEASWYKFKLEEFNTLPIDYFVIMAYDYQYNYGIGEPVTPLVWLRDVIEFTKIHIYNNDKIVIGLPTYGYEGRIDTRKINILSYNQAEKHPLFSKLKRDNESKELIFANNSQALVVQDEYSINAKVSVVKESGLSKVSLWHLGGNKLPSLK